MKVYLFYLLMISFIYCKTASEWRSRSIYQILTDRFCPSNLSHVRCIEQIMSENTSRNYCGGTYRGIVNQLNYTVVYDPRFDHGRANRGCPPPRPPPEDGVMAGYRDPRDDGRIAEVLGLVEKPRPEEAPSNLSIVGRYILMPEVIGHLARMERGAGGEVQLTDGMAKLIGTQPFHGLRCAGRRFDCGHDCRCLR